MSRKKSKQAVPDEVLAEGSGPVEVVAAEAPKKKASKKKFSKKKAPKGNKVEAGAVAGDQADGELSDELLADPEAGADGETSDELLADPEAGDELRADGETSDELHADSESAAGDELLVDIEAGDELRADGETSDKLHADSESDGETSDELQADSESAGETSDELLADTEADDELRADGETSDELHADNESAARDELLADAEITGDEVQAASGDELRVEGDDVVGAPITDEAGVEAALLPGALSAVQLRHLIEALIFATDKPVTLQRLRQLTRVSDVTRIESALAELQEDYKERGIALQQVSGGYQFRTNTAFSSWVQQLIAGRPVRLSRAQLETLAIVAYRQPITRPEIDEIRGVDSSNTLRLLLERSLIRVLGKREEVGRPTLYGTTKEFLDFFSLGDLRELPTLREYSELTAESRQVMSDRLGVPLDANGELEPEVSDELDPDQLEPDSTSIVDSILAEHAAAEAEAEARFDARDASAIAEAAMSGGSSFGHVADDHDAMSLSGLSGSSGGEMSTIGSRLPASEARSYVDAIRASVVESDELSVADELMSESREPHLADSADEASLSVADELMSESREPHMADAESSNIDDESNASLSGASSSVVSRVESDDSDSTDASMSGAAAAHVGTDGSDSIDPHVETAASMSEAAHADVGTDGSDSMSEAEDSMYGSADATSIVETDVSIDPHVETAALMSEAADVGTDGSDSEDSMSGSAGATSSSIDPHVETSESMSGAADAHVGTEDSMSRAADTTSIDPHVETDAPISGAADAHVGTDMSEAVDAMSGSAAVTSSSIDPHVETSESMSGAADATSIDPHVQTDAADGHVGTDDSVSMSGSVDPHVETDSMSASHADPDESSSLDPHVETASHVGSSSIAAASSSLDPHVETDAHLDPSSAKSNIDDESAGGHDESGSMFGASNAQSETPASDPGASPRPQIDGDTNSGESDLDAEPHVGHNAAVTREPDNDDPESSGN